MSLAIGTLNRKKLAILLVGVALLVIRLATLFRDNEHALELGCPYGDTPTVVVTSREWPTARKSVEFSFG